MHPPGESGDRQGQGQCRSDEGNGTAADCAEQWGARGQRGDRSDSGLELETGHFGARFDDWSRDEHGLA